MINYYSNVVNIQNNEDDFIEILFSQPNNFIIKPNYNENIVFLDSLQDRTSTCIVTITGSDIAPQAIWQYYDGTNWINIDNEPIFSSYALAPPPNPIVEGEEVSYSNEWTFVITIDSNADLSIWGNRLFTITLNNLSEYEEEEKLLLNGTYSAPFQFEMDWVDPPEVIFSIQPQSTEIIDGTAIISSEITSYVSITENWQYSDNYNPSNPSLAIWQDVDESHIFEAASSMTSGSIAGYGLNANNGPSYNVLGSSFSVSLLQWRSSRYYRQKVTT